MTLINPRAVIGGNNPPDAIELAAPHIEALQRFLADNPVISTEDEARAGHAALCDAASALKTIEIERKGKVEPLNDEVKAINGKYHKYHNTDAKRPGLWDKIVSEVKSRLAAFAREEERKRFAAEEAARRAAEEAQAEARRAAEAEAEAREAVSAGVCDVDLAGAMEDAQTTSQTALKAMWTARRAEGNTKVRITSGAGRAISLQDHEILTVTDWKAAVEEMSEGGPIPQGIADAIVKCARAWRNTCGDLPAGVEAIFERSL